MRNEVDNKNKRIGSGVLREAVHELADREKETQRVRLRVLALLRQVSENPNAPLYKKLDQIDGRMMRKAQAGYLGDFSNGVLIKNLSEL